MVSPPQGHDPANPEILAILMLTMGGKDAKRIRRPGNAEIGVAAQRA